MVFAIHWHGSAIGVHMFPILSTPSQVPPHPIPKGHPSAPGFVFLFLRKKDPHKISFCKDLRTIFIMLLWVSHQLNHDDVQHGRLSEGTWKQPGTPLLVHPSVISFAVVHCHSGAKSCPTLCDPMDCSTIKLTCLLKSYCDINIFLLRWIWVCISP